MGHFDLVQGRLVALGRRRLHANRQQHTLHLPHCIQSQHSHDRHHRHSGNSGVLLAHHDFAVACVNNVAGGFGEQETAPSSFLQHF